MKKGDVLTDIVVDTMAAEGKCVGRYNGQVVFISGAAPGDVADVMLTKIKSTFLEARAVEIKQLSSDRSQPFCSHFGNCGGCSWQHIRYDKQLEYKQKQVADNLERIGGLELPTMRPIMGSGKQRFYRNRLDFTFTAQRWLTHSEMTSGNISYEPGLGYHLPRKYDRVFNVDECMLQPDPSNALRLLVRTTAIQEGIPFFDLRKQTGFLRTLTIRTANSGEVMVILQVTYEKSEWTEKILSTIAQQFPAVTSIYYVVNGKRNDTFSDLDMTLWKGSPHITETMPRPDGKGTLQFRVGPKSFYQTNSDQAYNLYKVAWEMADLKGTEHVYDLYTGTGTIANFVAANAARVTGLEYVAAAIEDAKINSAINGITNTDFHAGDIKDLLDEKFLNEYGWPDLVITDPPRAGMHEDVVKMLLKAAPPRIVYVSCSPATQARDLKILSELYTVTSVQPVDMFPQTTHVENIVCCDRKNL